MNELLNIYQQNEVELAEINEKISLMIKELQIKANELNTKNEEIKEKIKNEMENNGVKKLENDYLMITYIAPTTRNTIDSKKLQEKYIDIYNECLKTSEVKSSIRIKIKENVNDTSIKENKKIEIIEL